MLKNIFHLIISFLLISCSINSNFSRQSEEQLINEHLHRITRTKGYRNYQNPETLNQVAKYIFDVFLGYCDTVYFQSYMVNGIEYKNVIGSFGIQHKQRLVVGAHYDVAGNQEGADDNASGVVGLLELARLLHNKIPDYRIDLVAYTLEEPPFFRTPYMGSYVHAKALRDSSINLKGMICLEMIGYFSDEPGSQEYPLSHKQIIYGNTGNYILIVQKLGNGSFGNTIKKLMKNADLVETKSLKAPEKLQGIDFSDHMNYWDFGFDAIMITNTAFYRNKNYHLQTDKIETLNIRKMSAVIDELYFAILNMN